ncbi:hypothetical protein BpHYR1_015181 [Brachionus plicatilis]|uniref:Uncharacterized protein n=1 Tax=Brachionus plicatilis TaxID=10195 RepID=A0A3M7QXI2_BRAPC|nr:hypothetical protein BpHYR1_015181 [Brachionus plicatilis]
MALSQKHLSKLMANSILELFAQKVQKGLDTENLVVIIILDPEEGHFGRNASINKIISFLLLNLKKLTL